MIKIAFDGQLFLKGNKTGIGWCADNLVKGLARQGTYKCQLNYFSKGYSEEQLKELEEYEKCGIELRSCKWFNDIFYKLTWPFFKIPYHWFFGSDSQIVQFFNYVIPPGIHGKKVTMVHDMAYLARPETVNWKTRFWLKLTLRSSCRRADSIITVSEFSKSELIKYLNIPENKIHVMYIGVDSSLYHSDYTQDRIAHIRKKYRIDEEYFLYLGTIEPRKNLVILLEAYAKLAKEIHNVPQLVLAGGNGWLYDEVYKTAQKVEDNGNIRFTGYVDQCDAGALMSGAKIFLFPSVYEGFGMPVVEAMACGTPVLTSNSTSLREIAMGAALLVEPESVESVYSGMKKLNNDSELRKKLIECGLERAKKFSWDNSVEIINNVYKELVK